MTTPNVTQNCWQERKTVQPFWEKLWPIFTKLKTHQLQDKALTPGSPPRAVLPHRHTDAHLRKSCRFIHNSQNPLTAPLTINSGWVSCGICTRWNAVPLSTTRVNFTDKVLDRRNWTLKSRYHMMLFIQSTTKSKLVKDRGSWGALTGRGRETQAMCIWSWVVVT